MVDTNFSINAAGNLAQYNLVKNNNNETEVINADDIKVMIKLGQFNKIRGLIRELENSSPDDKEAAQKIAAFAEFYKKEINSDLVYKSKDGSMSKKEEIIPGGVYEFVAREDDGKIDQYNVSDGVGGEQLFPEYTTALLDNGRLSRQFWSDLVDARTITQNDLKMILDRGDHEELYSLIQYVKNNDYIIKIDERAIIGKIQDYVVSYAASQETKRQFEKNPEKNGHYYRPVAELPASGAAEELAKFFESKGDTETANRIREEIKKVSDKRNIELEKHKVQYWDSKNLSKFSRRKDGRLLFLFDREQAKIGLERSESWNALDEESQERILDLLENKGQLKGIDDILEEYDELMWFEKRGVRTYFPR
jgi:hypothetical protein